MAEKLQIDVIAKTIGIKSLVDVYAAMKMVRAVANQLKDGMKQLTEAYIKQEKADKQLETVLKSTGMAAGLTYKELKNMASGLQNVTTFGDETIQSAQNLLLTFTKIGKDVFPQATETILNMSEAMGQDLKSSTIQLGKALNDPIAGITALSRVGVQLSDSQKKMIQTMQKAGDIAGAQKVILEELETQFGGTARAAADTFGGSLKQLENVQGDLMETGGKVVAIFGKDIVKAMTDSLKSVNEFINSDNKIIKLTAGWKTLQSILSDTASKGFEKLKDIISPITESFSKQNKETDTAQMIFTKLVSVTKLLGIGLSVIGSYLKLVVGYWVDVVKVVKSAIDVSAAFFDAATGKKKWNEVVDSVKNVGKSFKNLAVNFKDNSADMVNNAINQFKNYKTNVTSDIESIRKTYKDNYKVISELSESTGKDIEQKSKNSSGKTEDTWTTGFAKIMGKIKEFGDLAIGAVGNITDTIKMYYDDMFEKNLEGLNNWKEQHLEGIDDWMNQEMERLGVREETRSEQLQREIDELTTARNKENDVNKKAGINDQLNEKNKELQRLQIQEQAELKRQKIMQKAAKNEAKIKREQFEQNKNFQIGQIWMNAASAVLGWWASFASMGIPGIVLAGVMSAATLAMAGVQTGIVSSQTPGFATGIENFQGGVAKVHKDEALVYMPQGSDVVNPTQQDNYFGGGGSNMFHIENLTIVANNPESMAEQLKDISRYERVR